MSDETAVEELPRAIARARFVRATPMKVRRVVELIKGRSAEEALAVLRFAPQSASEPVAKVLASAVANAENNLDLDPDTLWISQIYVDEGPTLKRFRPRAQGRAYRIRKRTCHITIEVESVVAATPGRRAAKASPAKAASKAAPTKAAPATESDVDDEVVETPPPAKKATKAAKATEAAAENAEKPAKKAPAKKAAKAEEETE